MPRYWTLVLTEKATRLFEGAHENLVEIRAEGFPMTHEGPGGEQKLPGGFGVQKSAYRDERHRQFFRQVDQTLRSFLRDDPLPLVVVGVERYLAFFQEATSHEDSILATLTGSYEEASAHELSKLVWSLVREKYIDQRQQSALAELSQAQGERKLAFGIAETWQLAHEGRGRLLIVEENFHYPLNSDETDLRPLPAQYPSAPSMIPDAVDELIETVLSKQGEVVFVEESQLESHQHIALVLRY
jgi:hypothetical protein